MERYGLPNIQGLILLHDGDRGSPLAILESGYITINRTGAATAVATKYLARADSKTLTICGCGTQGRIQLEAVKAARPIEKVFAVDKDPEKVRIFCTEMSSRFEVEVVPEDLEDAIGQSDICVTCTPSREYFIKNIFLPQGIFVSAVGADSPDKQELQPEAVAQNKVVADILDQCVSVGEIHHAIEKGLMVADNVYGEIGEIIDGKLPGRTSESDIFIYDSTGTALQDVAAAATIYEKALEQGLGTHFTFPS
jgi:ornithine cyclodeaminase/alanine dehydrogenase